MSTNCTDPFDPACTCPNYVMPLSFKDLNCGTDAQCDYTIFCACRNTEQYGLFTEIPSDYQDSIWQQGLYIASIIGYSLLALVIHKNKSLQVHPMNLIYYITIVDGILLFDVFASYKVCDWHIHELFARTVLFNSSP
jgi:hypothetical protein